MSPWSARTRTKARSCCALEPPASLVTVNISESSIPVQEAADPSVRFDGEADKSGGILRIETEAGKTKVELRGGEDGGFLDISTPDREMRFGAGSGSSALPEWVPVYPWGPGGQAALLG